MENSKELRRQQTPKVPPPKQSKAPEYRVIAGRSINGAEAMRRLQNRSLTPSESLANAYNNNEMASDINKMRPIDAARAALKNKKHIDDLKNKLPKPDGKTGNHGK